MQATTPFASHSLTEWLSYLESIHPTEIELGLERVAQVAQRLDLCSLEPAKFVLVAGTNGKGSTCCYIEQCLMAAGYKVGVYSSPHVLDYKERVRVNGALLPDQQHCAAFATVELARGSTSLSYFEFGTLAALQLFKESQLDVVILEVGLGGRLDATNIVEPDVAVVTSIDFDHQGFLGSDLETIGFEKAGVFRSGKPAILGSDKLPSSVLQYAQKIKACPWVNQRDFQLKRTAQRYDYLGPQQQWSQLPEPKLPLVNLPTALAALEALGLELEQGAIQQGVAKASLLGRWQPLQESPLVILDVAHNPQATRLLLKNIQAQPAKRVLAVVAMLSDKDSASSLQPMLPHVHSWYVAGLDVPRGASSELLSQSLTGASKACFATVPAAMAAALESAQQDDMVIIFGSFYTVAEALAYWQE